MNATTRQDTAAKFKAAFALHQQGRLAEAERLYASVLYDVPVHFDALHMLGVVHYQKAESQLSLDFINQAIKINPNVAAAHVTRGLALQSLNRVDEALASYDQALLLKPDFAEAISNRGKALQALGQPLEALACYDRALRIRSDDAVTFTNRGNVLLELRRPQEALASYDHALRINSKDVAALCNRGSALLELRRPQEAFASYENALQVKPDHAEAINNRAVVLRTLKRLDEALAAYDHLLQLKPSFPQALYNRGSVLLELKRPDQALASYDRLLQLKPDDAEALYNRGKALSELKRYKEAADCFSHLLTVCPDHRNVLGSVLQARLKICDWADYNALTARILASVKQRQEADAPFTFLVHSRNAAAQLTCARIYGERRYPASDKPIWAGEVYQHDKIRIAYLSADFHAHATACLMAELFETHDKSQFEVFGISFGPDHASEMRDRVRHPFHRFIDVRARSDLEVAQFLRDQEIDIAIDLKGFTEDSRPGILAHRGVPLQVNYLGYPGTMGVDYIDYVIADRHIIPSTHDAFFSEKIIRLPDTYQVNDRKRRIDAHTPSRSDLGLPESGFVFCCFNNNYKIAPDIYDIWMRLLKQVEGSALWLLEDNAEARANLKQETEARGVSADRVIFAPRLKLGEHLARHRQADLFLDTRPYNAHTTASDALWANLPLLTCMGDTFASRVAGSLLHAVGLPELITRNLPDYEALALKLATKPAFLSEMRSKLARNRDVYPLFDTDRFRRHMEAAYITMHGRQQRGESKAAFDVLA